jgi:cell division protein ZapA
MPSIEVTINGRKYRMACEEGEEDRLRGLAQEFDARIAKIKKEFGEIGETRLTVMAALVLADELSEAERRLREQASAFESAKDVEAASAGRAQVTQAAIVAALDAASERIEQVTRGLNQGLNDGVPLG